ncbi:MAG: arginine repressor [Longimicrobiales bacterium]
MSKRDRHARILEVIREHRPASQEALRRILAGEGIDVTQATLSRDIRELRVVKVPGGDGSAHYTIPDDLENTPSLRGLLPTLFLAAEGVAHMVVIHTLKGAAQTVAAGIDGEEWPEVVGTLAGDDTLLVILRTPEATDPVLARIEAMAGLVSE